MWSRQVTILPQGAFRQSDGSVLWRIWAPLRSAVHLVRFEGLQRREIEMRAAGDGYFEYIEEHVAEGTPYSYRLSGVDFDTPDPVSRWQPDGVHRPSAVLFPDSFRWTDTAWKGIPQPELVFYELHVGTFTPQGTFEAMVSRLPELRELGVNAIELMPVAQFPGVRNWGYDGVHPFAAQNSYGGPRGLQQLVDAAHQIGFAVILDVVYNHIGPEGNYFGFFGPYFTDRYHTPWGNAMNFDGPHSDVVRQMAVDNACQWIRDFHIDGLRLDAVQMIFDSGVVHFLAQLREAVHKIASEQQRHVYVIAETDQNDPRLIRSPSAGGYGLDGVWADDFHHSLHALLTGEIDGYYVDFGEPEQLAKACEKFFVYDGCYSVFRRRRHGGDTTDIPAEKFVLCVQNHDQVGNHPFGKRLSSLVDPAAERMAAGLLLVSPATPLLFMGQEYGESAPFPFFCSFGDDQLSAAVRRGRREEFAAMSFTWREEIPDPTLPATFQAAKLSWSWPAGSKASGIRRLYADLLAWRRSSLRRSSGPTSVANGTQQPVVRACWVADGSNENANPGGLLYVDLDADRKWNIVANPSSFTHEPPPDRRGGKVMISSAYERYGGPRRSDDVTCALFPYEIQIRDMS